MQSVTAQQPITIFDIIFAIWTYKFRVAFTALFVMGLAVGFILLLPKKYESEAKLFIRLGRSSTSVDPAAVGQSIAIQDSRETEVNSVIDMLSSRGLAETVVKEIGEDRILKSNNWLEKQLEEAMALVSIDSEDDSKRVPEMRNGIEISKRTDSAVNEVLKNLIVESPKKSTTITLIYRARDPVLAHDVVQAIVENYRKMHVLASKADGSLNFFTEQFNEQQQILRLNEQQFREVKDQANILTMQGKKDSLQSEYNAVKLLQIQTQADYAAAKARQDNLIFSIEKLATTIDIESTSGIEQAASDSMRDRLYALEIEEKDLASRLFDQNPQLKTVRKQLEEAKKIMSDQPVDREHKVIAANPVLLEIQRELLSTRSSVASHQSKLQELDRMEKDLSLRISSLNELELTAESLERTIRIAQENYSSYARKLEESRIKAAMDQEALSNVSLVANPSIREKHTSPNRPLLGIVSGVFSLFLGAFVALWSDLNQRRRHFQHQLAERQLAERPTPDTRRHDRSVNDLASQEALESHSSVSNKAETPRHAIPR